MKVSLVQGCAGQTAGSRSEEGIILSAQHWGCRSGYRERFGVPSTREASTNWNESSVEAHGDWGMESSPGFSFKGRVNGNFFFSSF